MESLIHELSIDEPIKRFNNLDSDVSTEAKLIYATVVLRYPLRSGYKLKRMEKYRIGIDYISLKECLASKKLNKFRPLSEYYSKQDIVKDILLEKYKAKDEDTLNMCLN